MSVVRCWICMLFFLALVNKQSFNIGAGKWTTDVFPQFTTPFFYEHSSKTNKELETEKRVN